MDIPNDWKMVAQQRAAEAKHEADRQYAKQWRERRAREKRDCANQVIILNKWLADLHIPFTAKANIASYGGYLFWITESYSGYPGLKIGLPTLDLYKADDEWGKITATRPITSIGDVWGEVQELEQLIAKMRAHIKNRVTINIPKSWEQPQPVLLSGDEQAAITRLKTIIAVKQSGQPLNARNQAIWGLTLMVGDIECNRES